MDVIESRNPRSFRCWDSCLIGALTTSDLSSSAASHLTAQLPPGLPPGSGRRSAAAAACCPPSGHGGTAGSSRASRRIRTPESVGREEKESQEAS